jgi:hypothetical protein
MAKILGDEVVFGSCRARFQSLGVGRRRLCRGERQTRRGCGLGMPEYLADDKQAMPAGGTETRKRVPQVMQSNVVEASGFADAPPWPFEIDEVLARYVAANHIRISVEPQNVLQHCQ